MLYRNNSNIEIKLNRNPLELFKKGCSYLVTVCPSPSFRIIHIELPLISRLASAVNISCPRFDEAPDMSNKGSSKDLLFTPFLLRTFESNLYDNLSPPYLSWCDHDSCENSCCRHTSTSSA